MKRKIIHIHEDKCNGCGLCVTACHEGAIALVDGKAKLVSAVYCDGLGDCLPTCPTGAIEMVEREADDFDAAAVKERMEQMAKEKIQDKLPCGCPGTAAKKIERKNDEMNVAAKELLTKKEMEVPSELSQWPVQIKLISPYAPYLKNANLLIAADCTAFAYGNFHRDFIKDHVTIISCPKLDDNQYHIEKLTEILKNNDIKSITVVRMEVPCCSGIVGAVKTAMLNTQRIVPYKEVTISTDGRIIK